MVDGKRTFIVGEGGVNHNGYFTNAIYMINVAKNVGVDAIKFQTHFGFKGQEQYEFTKEQWKKLFDYCDLLNLKWFSTPFDFESIDFLKECGMDIWKIPSGMITQKEYFYRINSIKPNWVIMSTGMTYAYDEVLTAKHWLDCKRFTALHCVSLYPTPYNEVNLRAMQHMQCGWEYGLSDHTLGDQIPIAAVAMGASVIEKHFTLDRNMEGPDHRASLEPHELKEMVRCIRNVELAMGDGIKKPTPSELKVKDEIREAMECHLMKT